MKLHLLAAVSVLGALASAASCSSFNADASPKTVDGGTPDAGTPDAIADAEVEVEVAEAGPVDAGPCTDTCNSHHCDADGGCHPLVFVTDKKTVGSFGGISGGDVICNQEAAEANLQPDFVALLSDSQTNAVTRITEKASAARPVWRQDGMQVATAYTNIFALPANLTNSISKTATGGIVPNSDWVWTGTQSNGALLDATSDCSEWLPMPGQLGASGTAGSTNGNWINQNIQACNMMQHIYCFEIPP